MTNVYVVRFDYRPEDGENGKYDSHDIIGVTTTKKKSEDLITDHIFENYEEDFEWKQYYSVEKHILE